MQRYDDLLIFVRVVERGSFIGAARQLGLASPAGSAAEAAAPIPAANSQTRTAGGALVGMIAAARGIAVSRMATDDDRAVGRVPVTSANITAGRAAVPAGAESSKSAAAEESGKSAAAEPGKSAAAESGKSAPEVSGKSAAAVSGKSAAARKSAHCVLRMG